MINPAAAFTVGILITEHALYPELTQYVQELGGEVLILVSEADTLQAVQAQRLQALLLSEATLEVCRAVRALPSGKDLPVLSLGTDAGHIDRALAVDVTNYYVLPLPVILFMRHLKIMINGYQATQQINTLSGRFESLYENAPIIMHALARDGTILRVNQRWEEALGYTKSQVEGTPYLALVHPDMVPHVREVIKTFWETGVVRDFPSRLRTASGAYCDFIVDANAFEEPGIGKVSVSILHDVTQLRSLEGTLRSTAERNSLILHTIHDIVFVFDRDARYMEIPSIGNTFIQQNLSMYLGKTMLDFFGKAVSDLFVDTIAEVLASREPRIVDYSLPIEGDIRWFSAAITALNADQVVAVVRDISEVRRKEEAIRESDRLYRNLFDHSTDAILLMEMETGNIIEANESAALLLGYTLDEMRSLTIYAIEVGSEEVNDSTGSINVISNDRTLFEQHYRRKDGTLVPVESHSRIIRYNDKGAVLYFSRDITHRKQMLHTEYELRILAETLRDTAATFNQTTSLADVYDIAMRMVTRVISAPVANVAMIEDDHIRLVRWKGYDAFGYDDAAMGSVTLDLEMTPNFAQMIATRRPLCINFTENDTWNRDVFPTSDWVKSFMGAPIIVRDAVIGFLNLDSPTQGFFTEEHIEPLQAFANQMANAIENARLVEQLKTANAALESTVSERTDALIKANMSLRRLVADLRMTEDSLQRERSTLRMIIDSIPDMVYVKDTAGKYVLLNKASVTAMGGSTVEDLVGDTLATYFDAEYTQLHSEIDARIIATGTPVINMDNTMRYADGSLRRQLLSKQPLFDNQGNVTGIVGINRDITELRLIEQNLRDEREQLAQVLRSAHCLLWTATLTPQGDDYAWDLQIINEMAAQTFLPLDTGEKSYSAMWMDSIAPEDAARRRDAVHQQIQVGHTRFSHEVRCLRQDGMLVWLVEDVEIKQVDASHWALVGICTDITERKRAERNLQAAYDELELRIQGRTSELLHLNASLRAEVEERQRAEAAERRQRLLAEALTQSVATLNSVFDRDALFDYLLDTIVEIVPHSASNIMLVNKETMTGTLVRQRGYPDPLPEHLRVHDLTKYPDKLFILAHNNHFIIQDTHNFEGWAAYSEMAWIRSSLSVPISQDEGVIGFLNVEHEEPDHFTVQHAEWLTAFANQVALAIRNARLVEQIRTYTSDLEKTVQARTAELRAILGSIRDGLVYSNLADEPQYLNHALEDMLGYTQSDWFTQRPSYATLLGLDEDSEEKIVSRWERMMRVQGFYEEELTLQRQDGTRFNGLVNRVMVRDEHRERIGTLTLVRDISQEKELQEQRERFIANASHELRTPIANMKTRLYLLKRKPENFIENIEIAVSVTNWMQRLVDDMFDLARFQRGSMELQREDASVTELVREIMIFQQPEAERKEITLVLNAPHEDVTARIDPYRFMQVISNLVGNALNYTPEDGRVSVDVVPDMNNASPRIHVVVADTGRGISAEHIDNLFKPFYRASDDSRGAGLGLSIAQEIIRLHGGTITVDSVPGMGSRFIVTIPLLPAPISAVNGG